MILHLKLNTVKDGKIIRSNLLVHALIKMRIFKKIN